MRFKYLYLLVILFGILATACQSEFDDDLLVDENSSDRGSVITLVTDPSASVISLSLDAPAKARFGV